MLKYFEDKEVMTCPHCAVEQMDIAEDYVSQRGVARHRCIECDKIFSVERVDENKIVAV